MTTRVEHWDVFTTQPGKGNPAGIVLHADQLSDDAMQSIARSVGFNDTTFVMPSRRAEFRLRYFAPAREVDLCGHATVAAFSALERRSQLPRNSPGTFTLETRSGILTIGVETQSDGHSLVVMNQGTARFASFAGCREKLAQMLGMEPNGFHPTLPICYGSTGRWTLVVPVADLDVVQKLRPHQPGFPSLLAEYPQASIHPFCRQTIDSRACMHARHFSSPSSGTMEDAVTGTASGVLAAYYHCFIDDRADPNQPLVVEQGYEVGREGIVQAWATRCGDDFDVRIAGNACFVRDMEVA